MLESKNFSDLGRIYCKQSKNEMALQFHQKSIKKRINNDLKTPLITNYIDIEVLYVAQHKLYEVLKYTDNPDNFVILKGKNFVYA